MDVTQTAGIDDLRASQGVFRAAEERAARLWKADRAWFLVGGSSAGVSAMMVGALSPGQSVLLPRNLHVSAVWGLIQSGARPVFLPPRWNDTLQTVDPPTVTDVTAFIRHADALFVVSPTYFGVCADLPEIVKVAHEAGRIVLVDEAWGAHLGFHPGFPPSSMQAGVDLATCSVHKMLTGLSGTALLLAGSGARRVEGVRLNGAVLAVTTTSPYYGQLVSIEGCMEQMERKDAPVLETMMRVAASIRGRLAACGNVQVYTDPGQTLDPARVVFSVEGLSGFEVERGLASHGIMLEMATREHVVLVIGPSHRQADAYRLEKAVRLVGKTRNRSASKNIKVMWPTDLPHQRLTPREAFFASHGAVDLAAAKGEMSAESISVYPPGIPAILPGEEFDAATLDNLRHVRALGARLFGSLDPTLKTVQIVR